MRLSKVATKMIVVIAAASLVFIIAGAVYYRSVSALYFALGVLLGAALNALKVVMLERGVNAAVNMDEKDAGNYIRFQYLLRFSLTALILVLGVVVPFISLWGVVVGILTLQIAALSMKYFIGDNDKDANADGNL